MALYQRCFSKSPEALSRCSPLTEKRRVKHGKAAESNYLACGCDTVRIVVKAGKSAARIRLIAANNTMP